ncbi:hypothetical protein [Metapseudomonas otitidis]|uniref:hypothetical protein n=1 Tax=Metapseudomonas otitidis TaxID=319939 RepID=UPI001CA458BE|nr:hypothetical protein [Pseudomonas otitidis]QZX85157.1 hypothetical protein K6751_10790 [Pseudomonas otitidis]
MATVFISGSIKVKSLDEKVIDRLGNIVASGHRVVVGDAGGVDKAAQQYFKDRGVQSVTVYCTGDSPRNNDGQWPVVNVEPPIATRSRAFFTAKDLRMAEDSDFGLMVWDSKSTGTLSNVIELLKKGKKSVVYITAKRAFLNVGTKQDLEMLVAHMSPADLDAADKKISLRSKIINLQDCSQPSQVTLF